MRIPIEQRSNARDNDLLDYHLGLGTIVERGEVAEYVQYLRDRVLDLEVQLDGVIMEHQEALEG